MKTIFGLFIIVVLAAIVIDECPALAAQKKKNVVMRKTQNVEFEGDTVDGQGVVPDGAYLVQKRSVDFVPLYKVREHFDENIRASQEYLK